MALAALAAPGALAALVVLVALAVLVDRGGLEDRGVPGDCWVQVGLAAWVARGALLAQAGQAARLAPQRVPRPVSLVGLEVRKVLEA